MNAYAADLVYALRLSEYEIAVRDIPWLASRQGFADWLQDYSSGRYTPPPGICDEFGPLWGTLISAVVVAITRQGGWAGNATDLARETGMGPRYATRALNMAREDLEALGYVVVDTWEKPRRYWMVRVRVNDRTPRACAERSDDKLKRDGRPTDSLHARTV